MAIVKATWSTPIIERKRLLSSTFCAHPDGSEVFALRLLFVLPYVPSPIRVRPHHFIEELARRHDITVLAVGSNHDRADIERLRTACQRVEVVPLRRGAAALSCTRAILNGTPLQAAVCQSSELERRLHELLENGEYDLVHVEHLRAGHVGALIPSTLPTLFDSVDCISMLWERTLRSSHSLRQRAISAIELKRTRTYEAGLLGRFDRTIVTSAVDATALQSLAPASAVEVVPNGVDLEHFRPIDAPREPATLVLSGKMSYHANVTAALYLVREILPLVRRRVPDTRLRIVGSDPPAVIQNLARDPKITVTGRVPDIREEIAQATVAVCPVRVKVGIQNKVLEAMAVGVPVVSTREGAEGLLAVSGRDFLVANDPQEFADHTCRLLADKSLQDAIGRAGRKFVEAQHRWSRAAERLETLYASAIAQHGN